MNARLIDSTSVPLRREFLATFSKRAQMILFRVAKCALRLTWVGVFRREPAFWWRLPAMAPFGFAIHFLCRWKTRLRTCWACWDDLEAGRLRP
jgi:hypothetical protein